MKEINEYIITLDIDWAPEEVIDMVARQLIDSSVKATWFITHDSPSIRNLFKYPTLFEIGLHPNFMPGSTHGKSPEEVMDHIKSIYPAAESVRTHGLFQSSSLLKLMRDNYGIKYDSSIFLPYTANISPHAMYYSGSEALIRLPYFWADYTETNMKSKDFSFSNPKYHLDGMKIFNFHPIHIALNSSTLSNYNKLKAEQKIETSGRAIIERYRNKEDKGTASVFRDLIDVLKKKNGGMTLYEVADIWKTKTH